jgi:hypothetical protein
MFSRKFHIALVSIAAVLFLTSFVTGYSFVLLFAIASLISLAAFAEADRTKTREKLAFSVITFLMNLLLYDLLFHGDAAGAIMFSSFGLLIALASKGRLARSLILSAVAFSFLAWLTFSSVTLSYAEFLGADSNSLFLMLSLLFLLFNILTNILPALVFWITKVGDLGRVRLSNPCTGLYWTCALWLYLLKNIPTTGLSALGSVMSWIVFLTLLQEGAGLPSKIAIEGLRMSIECKALMKEYASKIKEWEDNGFNGHDLERFKKRWRLR